MWDLRSDDVMVIGLSDNSSCAGVGQEIWILPHLDYPLVYGMEEFDITTVQDDRFVSEADGFVRTSSLVDVHSRARRIVFVIASDSTNTATIGWQFFRIPVLDRFGNDPGIGEGPVIQDLAACINGLLNHVLMSPENLKAVFELYSLAYYPGGLNWMEVDNLALIAKARWHNKMSCTVTDRNDGEREKMYHYTPGEFEHAINIPPDGIAGDGLNNYGKADTVTCFDHIFLTREQARSIGHLKIGRWDSAAELAKLAGMAVYQAFDAENKMLVRGRMECGG